MIVVVPHTIPYHRCIPPLHTIPLVHTNFHTIPWVHTTPPYHTIGAYQPPLPPIRQRQTQEAIRQSQTGEIFRKRAFLDLSLWYLGKSGKLRQEKYSGKEQCFDVWISKVNWGWIKLLKFCTWYYPRPPGTFPRQWEAKYHISQNPFWSHSEFLFQPTGFSHGTDGGSCLDIEIQFPKYRNTCSCRPPPAPYSLLMIPGFPRAHSCMHR